MTVIPVIISVLLCLLIQFLFRNYDKNTQTKRKFGKYLEMQEQKFRTLLSDKEEYMMNIQNELETLFEKSEAQLNAVKRSAESLNEQYNYINGQSDDISKYFQKIDIIQQDLVGLESFVNNVRQTEELFNSFEEKISKHRSEIDCLQKNANSIKEEIELANANNLEEVKKQVTADFSSQMSLLQTKFFEVKSNIASETRELTDSTRQINEEITNQYNELRESLDKTLRDAEERINENANWAADEITNLNNTVISIKDKYIADLVEQIRNIDEENQAKINAMVNKITAFDQDIKQSIENGEKQLADSFVSFDNSINSKKEEILEKMESISESNIEGIDEKYKSILQDIISISERQKENITSSILKTSEDVNEKNKTTYDEIKNLQIEMDNTKYDFENFVNRRKDEIKTYSESTDVKIKKYIENYEKRINTIGEKGVDLEQKLFEKVKDSLFSFKNQTEKEILNIKTSFIDEITNYNNQISEVRSNLDTMSDEIRKIESFYTTSYEDLDNKNHELIEQAASELTAYQENVTKTMDEFKQYFDNQKAQCYSEIDGKVQQIIDNASDRDNELLKKYEIAYSNMENQLYEVKNRIEEKVSEFNATLDDKNADITQKLETRQNEFLSEIREKFINAKNEIDIMSQNSIAEIQNKLANQSQSFDIEMDEYKSKISDYKNQLSDEINSLSQTANTRMNEIDAQIEIRLNDLTTKSNSLEEQYKESASRIIVENQAKLDGFAKDFQEIQDHIFLLQDNLQNNVQDCIAQALSTSKNQLSDTKQYIDNQIKQISKDCSDGIDSLKQNIKEIENIYNERLNSKVSEFDKLFIEKSQEMTADMETISKTRSMLDSRIESFNNKIDEKQIEFEQKVENAQTELNQITSNLINERSQEVESLKYNYDEIYNKINNINIDLEQIVADKVENAKIQLQEIYETGKTDFAQECTSMQNQAKDQIYDFNIELVQISDKIKNIQNEYCKSIDDKISDSFDNINATINTFKGQLDGIQTSYEQKVDEMLQDSQTKAAIIATSYANIDSKIEEVKNTLEHSLLEQIQTSEYQLNNSFANKIKIFTDEATRIENEAGSHIRGFERDLKQFKETIINFDKHYTNKINEKFANTDQILNDKISQIDADYKNTSDKLIAEKNAQVEQFQNQLSALISDKNQELESFKNDFDSLGQEITQLKDRLDQEINNKVNDGNSMIAEVFEQGKQQIQQQYILLNEETNRYIKNHQSDIQRLREHITDVESQINDKIRNKLESADMRLNGKIDEMSTKYNDTIDGFRDSMSVVERDFRNKMSEIETNYVNKNDSIINKNFDKFNELRGKINELTLDVDHINEKFNAQLDTKVQEVCVSFDSQLNDYISQYKSQIDSSLTTIDNHYQERETNMFNEQLGKIASFEEVINNFDSRLSGLDTKIDEHLADKLNNADELYNEKMQSLIDNIRTAESSIDNKVKSIEDNIDSRIGKINETYQNETDRLLKDNFDKVSMLETKYESLQQDIFDMEAKTGTTLSNITDDFVNKVNNATSDLDTLNIRLDEIENAVSNNFNQTFETNRQEIEKLIDANKLSMINEYKDFEQELISKINDYRNDFETLKTDMSISLASTKDELRQIIDSGKNSMSEEYAALERESMNKLEGFRSELSRIQMSITDADNKLYEYISEKSKDVDLQASEMLASINSTYTEQIQNLESKIAVIEGTFSDKYMNLEQKVENDADDMLSKTNLKFDEINNQYQFIKEKLNDMRASLNDQIAGDISDKVNETKTHISGILNKELSQFNAQVQTIDGDFQINMDNYRKEITRIQTNMNNMEKDFTAKLLDHSNTLSIRIAAIESEVQNFERNTSVYERANALKDKLNNDIKEIKDIISSIRNDRTEIIDIQRQMQSINNIYTANEDKYQRIVAERKNIDKMADQFNELQEFTAQINDKINTMQAIKASVVNVEEKLNGVDKKFKAVGQYMEDLADKEINLQNCLSNIEEFDQHAATLSQKLSNLDKQFDEIDLKRSTYFDKMKEFEQKASIITKSTAKVDEVISMYKNIDDLAKDVSNRTEQINKQRKWLVTAETNVENMAIELDKKIQLFESLVEKGSHTNAINDITSNDEKKQETVLNLLEQNWTHDDIAKTLSLSLAEVDLISEMNYNKK